MNRRRRRSTARRDSIKGQPGDRAALLGRLEKIAAGGALVLGDAGAVEQGNAVSWKKARAINSVGDFFQVIKDVRNNLFHGEKQAHSDRDGELISAAQQTLDLAWQAAVQAAANPKLVNFCTAFRYH